MYALSLSLLQSYIHQNHAPTDSWLKDGTVERDSGKGKRLIILHAITKDGPLGERSLITWKGSRGGKDTDTPHEVKKVADGPDDTSAELLWVSNSKTGDYHDNMNSEMFMQCTHASFIRDRTRVVRNSHVFMHAGMENRCMPTFKRLHPGKMMIPCMDNAPYHHNRGMPSLSSMKTKKELYELMTKGAGAFPGLPEGATLTLPAVEGKRPTALTVPVTEEMLGTAHKSKPKIPSVEEMKLSFLEAVRADDNLKHHLNCKLEEFIVDHNTRINPDMQLCTEENATANHLGWGSFMLWTPPYCLALQPIEEFWGVGKNFATAHYENDHTMRECIGQLQDGWYGNLDHKDKYGKPKAVVKCGSLVRHMVEAANVKLKQVGGLTGIVGAGMVKLLPGVEIVPGDGETDMFVEHIETVDLTQDEDAEPDVLAMTEDDAQDHMLQLAAQGDHDLLAADDDDAELQLGMPSSGAAVSAPSDSPAKAAQERAGRY